MQGLTKRQEQTLDFIRRSIEDRGYPPTLREIGEHMGIRSTNGVNDHLRALERKGYLTREDMKSRALKLVQDDMPAPANKLNADEDLIEVRVLGRVAAGLPLYAEENVIDTVRVDRMLVLFGFEVDFYRRHGVEVEHVVEGRERRGTVRRGRERCRRDGRPARGGGCRGGGGRRGGGR